MGRGMLAGRAASMGAGIKSRFFGFGIRAAGGCDTCGDDVVSCGCEEEIVGTQSGGLFGKYFNRGGIGCDQGDCASVRGGLGGAGLGLGSRLRGLGAGQVINGCESCGSADGACGCDEVVSAGGGGLLGNRFAGRGLGSGLGQGGLSQGRIGQGAVGCGSGGCGIGGNGLCHTCRAGHGLRGQIPHTSQPPQGMGPGAQAPSYAYPYYTTRAPRDFLMDNPPSIGW